LKIWEDAQGARMIGLNSEDFLDGPVCFFILSFPAVKILKKIKGIHIIGFDPQSIFR
jgi:hypothetical protein